MYIRGAPLETRRGYGRVPEVRTRRRGSVVVVVVEQRNEKPLEARFKSTD